MTTVNKKTVAQAKPKSAAKASSKPAKDATKAKKKSAKEEEKVIVPEGLSADAKIIEVPLSDINKDDTRFQYRVDQDLFIDIVESLKTNGQQVPIILWGRKRPYIVIDGHRRTRAAITLKMDTLRAIVRDVTEPEAYRLAFLENGRRKNFTKLDLAHALWVLIHRRNMSQEQAQDELGLSASKAGRLLKLISLPDKLQKAVRDGDISMHHALRLDERKSISIDDWLLRIKKEKLSVRQLTKKLGAGTKKKGRNKVYFKTIGDGFFLSPIRFNPKNAPKAQRDKWLEDLRKAIELIEGAELEGEAK